MINNKHLIVRKIGKLEVELVYVQSMRVHTINDNLDTCPYCLNVIDIEKIIKKEKEIEEELKTLEQKLSGELKNNE